MSEVDEVLEGLYATNPFSEDLTDTIGSAKSQLLNLMLECVGEDEVVKPITETTSQTDYEDNNLYPEIRNELRTTIRQNILNKFGGK